MTKIIIFLVAAAIWAGCEYLSEKKNRKELDLIKKKLADVDRTSNIAYDNVCNLVNELTELKEQVIVLSRRDRMLLYALANYEENGKANHELIKQIEAYFFFHDLCVFDDDPGKEAKDGKE